MPDREPNYAAHGPKYHEWHLPDADDDQKKVDLVVRIDEISGGIEIGSRWRGTMAELTPEEAIEVSNALFGMGRRMIKPKCVQELDTPARDELMRDALFSRPKATGSVEDLDLTPEDTKDGDGQG